MERQVKSDTIVVSPPSVRILSHPSSRHHADGPKPDMSESWGGAAQGRTEGADHERTPQEADNPGSLVQFMALAVKRHGFPPPIRLGAGSSRE
jgi:hypothetical protein